MSRSFVFLATGPLSFLGVHFLLHAGEVLELTASSNLLSLHLRKHTSGRIAPSWTHIPKQEHGFVLCFGFLLASFDHGTSFQHSEAP